MRTATITAAVVTAALAAGGTASAASAAWFNTPAHVAQILVNHYNTSDGEPIVQASCTGVWSAPHARHAGRMYFHRLRCGQWDDLDRHLGASVTVTGATSLRVFQTWCSDSASEYACPGAARADASSLAHTVKYQYHGRMIVLHEIGVPHRLTAEPAPTDREIHAHGVNRRAHYRLTVVHNER